EIAGLFLDAPTRGDIEHAANADSAVQGETRGGPAGALEFGLDQGVREDHRLMQLADEVANGVFARIRNDVVVDLREWLDPPLVEEHVESETLPVQWL